MSTLTENHPPTPPAAGGRPPHALRWGVTFGEAEGMLTLGLKGEGERFAGLPARTLHKVITRLDGAQTPSVLAGRTSVKPEFVGSIVRLLAGQARDAYEHFVLFFEGLSDYYGDAYAFVPRQAFDVRLVLR